MSVITYGPGLTSESCPSPDLEKTYFTMDSGPTVGIHVDSEIVLSTRNGNVRVFINSRYLNVIKSGACQQDRHQQRLGVLLIGKLITITRLGVLLIGCYQV